MTDGPPTYENWQPDYWIDDPEAPEEPWQTLDFMFTMDANNSYGVDNFNFATSHRDLKSLHRQLDKQLKKAAIIPLDMCHLNAQNRAKVLTYLLSLPQEQQDRIKLLVREHL